MENFFKFFQHLITKMGSMQIRNYGTFFDSSCGLEIELEVLALSNDDIIIPTLVKKQFQEVEKNIMHSIPEKEGSVLYTLFSQNAAGQIRLQFQPFPIIGDQPDYIFDGKLQTQSNKNFIVFHHTAPKRLICVVEELSPSYFSMELSYPISPLQGFLLLLSFLFKKSQN
jgi:hypothetical protein